MEYDDIVVGAGSAGAVIAARLSEDADRQVLLVEAGHDYENIADIPAPLLAPYAAVIKDYNWDIKAFVREPNLRATLQDATKVFSAATNPSRISLEKTVTKSTPNGDAAPTRFNYPVGRVIGGSSSVNGGLAMRGLAEDYDEWVQMGNPIWSWANVLERFRALESNQDTSGPEQGNAGRIPIECTPYNALHPVQRDFFTVCQSLGFSVGEHYSPYGIGIGSIPRNIKNNQRISTAIAYLAQARTRKNLTISANTLVNRVLSQGSKAVGIEALVDGRLKKFLAKRIVLTAGAINSPAILMRSGIGPSAELSQLGIKPVMDLPGVGKNLIDHPSVGLWLVPRPGVCSPGEDIHQVMLRYTSKDARHRSDMQIFMLNSIDTAQFPELQTVLGVPLGMSVTAILGKPNSRGRLELASADMLTPPRVYLNCATDPDDMRRLMEGVRLAWRVIESRPLKDTILRAFAWNQRIIDSDTLLRESISIFVRGSWHAVGTARMGPHTDSAAVVDQYGSVHGCTRLTVADASIMPTIPRAPTNLTCMMMAEKIAMHLRNTNAPEVLNSKLNA